MSGAVPGDTSKIVWILGAGFSKPLGGPLLKEWFQDHLDYRVEQAFGAHAAAKELLRTFPKLRNTYAPHATGHKEHDLRVPSLQKPWRDAEEFLTALDIAARDGEAPHQKVVRDAIQNPYCEIAQQRKWDLVLDTATRYLAAATEFFVTDIATESRVSEKWHPYFRWLKALTPNDLVVTFNYDRVVEAASAINALEDPNSHPVHAPSPSEDDWRTGNAVFGSRPTLLKLHGSVTWFKRTASESIEATDDPRDIIFDSGRLPVIGVPGPGKSEGVAKYLGSVWTHARTAVTQADTLVFIGYRFPTSDSKARSVLVEAVRAFAEERRRRQLPIVVRVVLGPRTADNSHDIDRVEGILRWAVGSPRRSGEHAQVLVEPLWAEDFLSVFVRDELVRPVRWSADY